MKKSVKILIAVIIAILIATIVIGLWSYSTKNKKIIADYLSKKYGENFTVIKVGNAFNGNDLRYKYAIAQSNAYEEEIYILLS